MKKVVIIASTVIATPAIVGESPIVNLLNPFKKNSAKELKTKLEESIKSNKLNYTIEIDQSFDSANNILNSNTDLLLISPLIKKCIDVQDINEFKFYELNEDEYFNTNIDNIVAYLKAYENITL